MTTTERWEQFKASMPLIAILRGVGHEEVLDVVRVLHRQGFKCVEVPLNSPQPFRSIEKLVLEFGQDMIVGAGTVLSVDDVEKTLLTGAQLVVAPNLNEAVAQRLSSSDALYCPGVATATEAFRALDWGADALKMFPAELLTPEVVKALKAVLPMTATLLPVGGIEPGNMSGYLDIGVSGFGIGSALYKPGKSLDELEAAAQRFVEVYRSLSVSV